MEKYQNYQVKIFSGSTDFFRLDARTVEIIPYNYDGYKRIGKWIILTFPDTDTSGTVNRNTNLKEM